MNIYSSSRGVLGLDPVIPSLNVAESFWRGKLTSLVSLLVRSLREALGPIWTGGSASPWGPGDSTACDGVRVRAGATSCVARCFVDDVFRGTILISDGVASISSRSSSLSSPSRSAPGAEGVSIGGVIIGMFGGSKGLGVLLEFLDTGRYIGTRGGFSMAPKSAVPAISEDSAQHLVLEKQVDWDRLGWELR